MSKSEIHIEHLSLDQIKGYLEGKLDKTEMFKVERHILDCEFCQEAMDGLKDSEFGLVNSDLDEIRQKLSERVQPQMKPSVFQRYRYLGIAASLAIILASTFFLFNLNTGINDTQLSQKESKSSEKDTSTGMDSALSELPLIAESVEEILVEEPEVEDTKSRSDVGVSQELTAVGAASGAGQADELVVDSEEALFEVDEAPTTLSEEVTISTNQGLTQLDDLAGGDEAISEDIAFFEEEAIVEEELIAESPRGEKTLSIPTEAAPPKVAMSREDLSKKLNTERARAVRRQAVKSKSALLKRTDQVEPEPVDGIEQYQQYLKENLNYPTSARDLAIEGTVEVKAVINSEGRPVQLEVIKSLSEGCDQEALRLIESGPDWKPGEVEVIIEVVFELNN